MFGPSTSLQRFPDELEALRTGDKAMSVWGAPLSFFDGSEEPEDWYKSLVTFAAANQLVATHHFHHSSGPSREEGRFFIARPSESWRINAYIELKKAYLNRQWSDGAEALESRLLGYPDTAIASWLAYIHHTQAGWGMTTLYLLLSDHQSQEIASCGFRYIPLSALHEGLVVIEVRNHYGLRMDIGNTFEGRQVARCGVSNSVRREILDKSTGDTEIVQHTLERERATILSRSLLTAVHLWTHGQWQ